MDQKPKKGNVSWRPHRQLDVRKKDPTKRLRWVNSDPANLEKKQAEGWSFVQGGAAVHDRPNTVEHGSGIGTLRQYRDLVLMEMPEDTAIERNRYYEERTSQQSKGIEKQMRDNVGKSLPGATVYGEVKIS